jgi:hypothetical protein
MELEFKKDFASVRQRWDAFWAGTNPRPLVSIVIPKAGVAPADAPAYLSGLPEGKFGPVIDQRLRWAETHEFLGDALPFHYIEFGPSTFAAYLGVGVRYDPDSPGTNWAEHVVEDWDDFEIKFRRDSVAWQQTIDYAEQLRARCEGKLLIAAPTLSGNLDALEALRGADRLLMDLVDCPEKVQRALSDVRKAYAEVLDALGELLNFSAWGSITRHGMYHTGRVHVPQCDFSCMISPAMFREFALPGLKHELSLLDTAEYHLDGPGAIKHLEAVCEIEKVRVIQWVPGAGEPETRDWMELYKRIDALGKGLILGADVPRMKRLWSEFKTTRLFLGMGAKTRAEAEDILAEVDKLPRK